MHPRLRTALALLLDAVADGHVTAAEAIEVLETLLPRDVVLEVAEDVAEWVGDMLDRDPARLRKRAAEHDRKAADPALPAKRRQHHRERAVDLYAEAAEIEAATPKDAA